MSFHRVKYNELNARQKEAFNFQKVSSVLAEYGFETFRITDDWQGADFIAIHFNGETILRVQLKSRLFVAKKYIGKKLWVCFRHGDTTFLYPHDKILKKLLGKTSIGNSESWKKGNGGYSFNRLTEPLVKILTPYSLSAIPH